MTEQERNCEFQAIYKRNYQRLYQYAVYLTGDYELSRDLVSDVFGKAYEHYEPVQLDSVDAYLFLSLRNHCIDTMRHQKIVDKYARLYVEYQDVTPATWEQYDERLDTVMEIICTLPDKTRTVMEQCYLEEKTYKEVGAAMGMTDSGVRKHIMKGLNTIRERFGVSYNKRRGHQKQT